MRIQSPSYLFCSESLAGGRVGFGLRLNGAPVLDVAQLAGADFATVYGRGRGPFELTVSVWRFFSTEALALAFMLTHPSTVPLENDITVVDDDEAVALTMVGAVTSARPLQRLGVAVLVEYAFTGARFESDDVPDAPTDSDTVKAQVVNLIAGEVSKAVTFDTPFASAPRFVQGQLSIPDSGSAFGVVVRESTRAAAGVTFDFDAAVPATGTYKLLVFAAL